MLKFKNYIRVGSLQEAFELNQKKSSVVAGGMMWLKVQDKVKMTLIDLSDLGLNTIEETEEEFRIGCMCSLRQLETHEGLNSCFNGVFKACTRGIVGVQFRNGATIGGSIFGRAGFSELLTCLMALDSYVELYQGGVVSVQEFSRMPYDRDILVRIIIKKDGRRIRYASERLAKTDFPLIACCVAEKDGVWYLSTGARPSRAALITLDGSGRTDYAAMAEEAAGAFSFGTNTRAGADYRRHLAQVWIRRLMEELGGEA